MEDEKFVCCNCSCEVETDEEITSVEGDVYCQSCADEMLHYCEHCGRLSEESNNVQVSEGESEYWCDECVAEDARECDDCGDWIVCSLDYGPNDRVICPGCYEDHYVTCDDCGEVIHIDAMISTPEGAYCEDCADNHTQDNSIHDYRYTPRLNFHRGPEEKGALLFLGFELEAGGLDDEDDADDTARNISEGQEDWLYCKSDGSIPDYGFELVSHPATLAAHKGYTWPDVLGKMSSAGLKSHDIDNCGLHVHVNRSFLTSYRWILVDWLISKNRRAFEKIARRRETNWARFTKNESGEPLKEVYAKRYFCHSYRYRAVNFENEKTVEFRLFKGTLKPETFMATLEIVDAVVRWAKSVRVHDILKSRDAFGEFKKYIENNPGRYENAVQYLKAKHI